MDGHPFDQFQPAVHHLGSRNSQAEITLLLYCFKFNCFNQAS